MLGGEDLKHILFDYSHAVPFVTDFEIEKFQTSVELFHNLLHDEDDEFSEYTGWIDLPFAERDEELEQIERATQVITQQSDVLLVIGVGGSYLGSRAAIEMMNHHFYQLLEKEKRKIPQILFVGHHLSSSYIVDLINYLEDKDFSINVISKSGTTTEPAIAFRIFRALLEKKYGDVGARKRIFVTTDQEKGALRALATEKGYETFSVPENIGGRYSVLTSVGLLPMAVGGIHIQDVLKGAAEAASNFAQSNLSENIAYQYAVIRNVLYEKGKTIEALVTYEPSLQYFSEWWKQLFGESEGKEGKGIFPVAFHFSTDLHSIGQYIQEGERDLFETVIKVKKPKHDIVLDLDSRDLDGLNYLAGKTVDEINSKSFEGALNAHVNGGVPNLVIHIPALDAFTFGYLVYFFQKACAMSGCLLGVHPFNQPGVEKYKNNMFALLGKPGYEHGLEQLKNQFARKIK